MDSFHDQGQGWPWMRQFGFLFWVNPSLGDSHMDLDTLRVWGCRFPHEGQGYPDPAQGLTVRDSQCKTQRGIIWPGEGAPRLCYN